MNLKHSVESAELQFKQILEDFFTSVYDEKSLSSHGIDHHRRVWNNAKELLSVKNDSKSNLPPQFTLKLIIACYLHDIGISVDSGIRHGNIAGNSALTFFSKTTSRSGNTRICLKQLRITTEKNMQETVR